MATAVSGSIATDTTWTRAASPYEVTGSVDVQRGVKLVVEPGVGVRFGEGTRLASAGSLTAVGTAEAPIRFTGTAKEPGWWEGLRIEGRLGLVNADSTLDHVHLEYAGYSNHPACYVSYGQVQVRNSLVRMNGMDGVVASTGGAAGTIVEATRIVGNGGYGVRTSTRLKGPTWWPPTTGGDMRADPPPTTSAIHKG
jgi:hypothetical protein